MKGLRNIVITLVVVLTITAFFPGISAFADADGSHSSPPTTASEADSANDRPTMQSFVSHAKQHIDDAVSGGGGELSAFFRQMRTEEEWNNGSVYLITLNQLGSVTNHGIYTSSLFNDSLRNLPAVNELFSLLENAQGGPVCHEYQHYMDGSSRWTCAVEYDAVLGGTKSVLIGGFDHAEDDQAIGRLECAPYNPAVTAEDVTASQFISESQSRETLRTFVKEAIKRIAALAEQGSGGGLRSALAKIGCLGKEGPWKSGSIYLFIMRDRATGDPTVIVNGNNPEFTGSDFVDVLDEDGVDIGAEILKVAGEDEAGDFVEYKWDNPLIEEDDLTIPGMSPGRSPKISYVEGVTFPVLGTGTVFIFGSGIYKPLEATDSGSSDGDDGCAIAGTGSKTESTVFNLFLIVFSLCIAFWWKDRSKK